MQEHRTSGPLYVYQVSCIFNRTRLYGAKEVPRRGCAVVDGVGSMIG